MYIHVPPFAQKQKIETHTVHIGNEGRSSATLKAMIPTTKVACVPSNAPRIESTQKISALEVGNSHNCWSCEPHE